MIPTLCRLKHKKKLRVEDKYWAFAVRKNTYSEAIIRVAKAASNSESKFPYQKI